MQLDSEVEFGRLLNLHAVTIIIQICYTLRVFLDTLDKNGKKGYKSFLQISRNTTTKQIRID